MKHLPIIMLYCLFGIQLQARENLTKFTADQFGDRVRLVFTLNAGFTCHGITIQRSEDSMVFEEIGFIPGICGDLTTSQTYTFYDVAPLQNKKNYYRLLLQSNESRIISINYYSLGPDGILIMPQYNSREIKIVSQRNDIDYSIYSLKGELIGNGKLALRENSVTKPGNEKMYVFIFRQNGHVVSWQKIYLAGPQ